MFVCICRAVTDRQIDVAISAGARTGEAVGEMTGAGTGCGSCLDTVCERLMTHPTAVSVASGPRAAYALA